MDSLNLFSQKAVETIWSLPLISILVVSGLLFTIYFFFPQRHLLKHAIRFLYIGKFNKPINKRGIFSQYRALSLALAGTVGMGSISGVAVAIYTGGPGAIFWMWIAAFLGMAIKFPSITLSMIYRSIDETSDLVHGGPMYTYKNGLKRYLRPLAFIFSIATIIVTLCFGNLFQSQQVASVLNSSTGLPIYVTGILFCLLTSVILIGGIKRIGQVTSKLVPAMNSIYIIVTLAIVIHHSDEIANLFVLIFNEATNHTAIVGGGLGFSFKQIVTTGFRRAFMSNHIGAGSAAIAHSTAKSRPVGEGIVGMLGPFIDTIVIGTLTALVLLLTKVTPTNVEHIEGATLLTSAITTLYGNIGKFLILFIVIPFAFSSTIAWSYYGEKGVMFLFGDKGIKPYRALFILLVLIGPFINFETILNLSDAALVFMIIPNLIACFLLAPVVRKYLKKYNADMRAQRF